MRKAKPTDVIVLLQCPKHLRPSWVVSDLAEDWACSYHYGDKPPCGRHGEIVQTSTVGVEFPAPSEELQKDWTVLFREWQKGPPRQRHPGELLDSPTLF